MTGQRVGFVGDGWESLRHKVCLERNYVFDPTSCLTIGIASSALFDLSESDYIFKTEGVESYERFQKANTDVTLNKGVAFPFIQRILALNDLVNDPDSPLVEVIVLSRNSPVTGIRVQHSIETYQMPITRAIYTEGTAPYKYMQSLDMELFLSANKEDVYRAINENLPAGQILGGSNIEDDRSEQLRVAFDFDGVLADDESERIFAERQLEGFTQNELEKRFEPMNPGPLKRLLERLNHIQNIEKKRIELDESYIPRLEISLVTARNAPAYERAVNSMESWGLTVNNAFFLGGIEKGRILNTLKPHIFFDDQVKHLKDSSEVIPSVHVPFGFRNMVE